MAKKAEQSTKKKVDWKKVLTLVVVIVLVVLKLMYGDGEGATAEPEIPDLAFRSEYLLEQHYEKHGIDMGFASAEEYEAAACLVIANPETLHKIEAEDGDDVYYLESTNEFVVVSKDGYIRTYFLPDDGIKYYNRQ